MSQIVLQTFVSVSAFRQQPASSWPPGGWPPTPGQTPSVPAGPGNAPTLEPQPHKPNSGEQDWVGSYQGWKSQQDSGDDGIQDNHWHPDVYRQWATRFDTKPLDHAYLLHPENRAGYDEYISKHPRHPTYPNSVDRSAESLVIVVFALVGLSFIFATVIVVDRLQARHLSSKSITFGALSLVFGPWLLLWTWVLLVIVSNVDKPTRGHGDQWHWACPVMLAYLGVFLVVHTINVLVQAYAEWHTLFPVKEGRMGQMFRAIDEAEAQHPTWVKPVRGIFLVLDVLIALFGIWLVFFSGPHRDFCQPAIWWTSAAIASVTGAAFLAGAVMFGCWRCVGILAARSSGRDFLAFFRVLYHGDTEPRKERSKNHDVSDDHVTFTPASDPVVETKPLLPQSNPVTAPMTMVPMTAGPHPMPHPMLHHAATMQPIAHPMHQSHPMLQRAATMSPPMSPMAAARGSQPMLLPMGSMGRI